MPNLPNLEAAEDFIWRTARLLDRHRYAYLFKNGEPSQVVAALRPYQNPDGGFGHALEPDLRGPVSQPLPVLHALEVLDEVDAFDDPMVRRACDYLLAITTAEGGVPFVLPLATTYPHAWWMEAAENPPASLNPTAPIAGLLHKHGVVHPWLERATTYCWQQIEQIGSDGDPRADTTAPTSDTDIERIGRSYTARAALAFLAHVPDRRRAEDTFALLGRYVLERKLVELDPSAPGEVHTPLDYAPSPQSLARRLFSDEVIAAHLDALVAKQQSDGGWPVNWQIWTPATGLEWRAWVTIRAISTLRDYGRLA